MNSGLFPRLQAGFSISFELANCLAVSLTMQAQLSGMDLTYFLTELFDTVLLAHGSSFEGP
jgi:hypothetical protein